ncbi:MAG: alpha-amylase family glycosyl hydrolase [Asticcacaulis sp.]
MNKRLLGAVSAACLVMGLSGATQAGTLKDRPPEDEIIYFVLTDRFHNGDPTNDRGGLTGGREVTGFDPTSDSFYHGGDFKGLTQKLDYIQGLGATAIWMSPPFKNQPVVGSGKDQYAGYHGYYINDFMTIDPHFGSEADFRAFVEAAHARGMKVYLDIVINHTGDIIKNRECPNQYCDYRSTGDYPALGANESAYTPFVPKGMEKAKNPDWLNDLGNYHNRGESTYEGESSIYGDFAGLDGIKTENPEVIKGFIDIYSYWIDEYKIDGYRIDTARHVNPEFWQIFIPAIEARARANGIKHFHIFGEIMDNDVAIQAVHTLVDGIPNVLDFPMTYAVLDVVSGKSGTHKMTQIFRSDAVYAGGTDAARRHATFTGNHDIGRIGFLIRDKLPDISDNELLKRVELAHAMVLFSRGVPVLYYGDEQGFVGDGHDRGAREDMMPSQVVNFNDNRLIGNKKTTAEDNFDTDTYLYQTFGRMAQVRHKSADLRYGETAVKLHNAQGPGILAIQRKRKDQAGETLVIYNTANEPLTANVPVEAQSRNWRSLYGQCASVVRQTGSLSVNVPPLGVIVCESHP